MSSKTIVKCPYCEKAIAVENMGDVPFTRARLTPRNVIKVYNINTDEMKEFIQQKLTQLKEGTKVDLVATFSQPLNREKKRKKKSNDFEKVKGRGNIRIAFSHHIIEGGEKQDWFLKAGENESHPTIVNTILKNVIEKYSYDRKEIGDALKNYSEMERLETKYGITEEFLRDIYNFCIPKAVSANAGGDLWVLFSAMPEKIIADMLEDPESDDPNSNGLIEIVDVCPVSSGVLEYVVYLHPIDVKREENIFVRKLLMGDMA